MDGHAVEELRVVVDAFEEGLEVALDDLGGGLKGGSVGRVCARKLAWRTKMQRRFNWMVREQW